MAFIHNGTYKLASVVDGCVVDLSGGRLKKGTKILAWHWTGTDHQKWKADSESDGLRLSSIKQDGEVLYVIDEFKDSSVGLWPFSGKNNQQWVAERIFSSDEEAYLIKNVKSGLCIRNMGHGNQLKCVAESLDDKSLWWKITSA